VLAGQEDFRLTLIQWRGYVFLDRIRQGKNRYRKGQEHIEKWDRVTGYILLFIGVTAAWSSTQLSMGKFKHPGPGFLPFGLSVILIFLSFLLILPRKERGTPSAPFWPRQTWMRPFLGLAIFILYAILLGRVGFLITTFIFLLLWLGGVERIRWGTVASISALVTAALYLIFGFFLEVPLPGGILNW